MYCSRCCSALWFYIFVWVVACSNRGVISQKCVVPENIHTPSPHTKGQWTILRGTGVSRQSFHRGIGGPQKTSFPGEEASKRQRTIDPKREVIIPCVIKNKLPFTETRLTWPALSFLFSIWVYWRYSPLVCFRRFIRPSQIKNGGHVTTRLLVSQTFRTCGCSASEIKLNYFEWTPRCLWCRRWLFMKFLVSWKEKL